MTTRGRVVRARMGAGLLAVFAAGSSTSGQSGAPPAADPPDPIVSRHEFNNRSWTLTVQLRVLGAERAVDPVGSGGILFVEEPIAFDALTVVFPVLEGTGFADVFPERSAGRLRLDGRDADREPRLVGGYPGPTSLLAWDAADVVSGSLSLRATIECVSYETRVDEDRAFEVPWPQAAWAEEIAVHLEPQLFVEPADEAVGELVERWTKGSPRRAKPYHLAKYLAGRVLEHVQPDEGDTVSEARGAGQFRSTVAFVSGLNVNGSGHAARTGRGSTHDLAALLTAVYRAAGLPARLVVCFDVSESLRLESMVLRTLVEFYLLDERTGLGEWVPVDIVRQRQFSSRAPKIERGWEFFGRSLQSDFLVPVAHHFHPPTAVTNAGPPALWGWVPDPEPVGVDAQVYLSAFETPARASDRRERDG